MNVAAQTARRRDSFYLWVAIAAALIVFFGFARTYYLKGVFGTPPLSILLHAHAVLVTLWSVLFLIQARLVATHRIDLHRQLGVTAAARTAFVALGKNTVSLPALLARKSSLPLHGAINRVKVRNANAIDWLESTQPFKIPESRLLLIYFADIR